MKTITPMQIKKFYAYLIEDEKASATISKYVHDVEAFTAWLTEDEIDKSVVLSYKNYLLENYSVASANSMLASLNSFFRFAGWESIRVKQFRVQKKAYCKEEKELSKQEYLRLTEAAEKKDRRLSLVMQTICSSGIRVSELPFITVEAVKQGEATVSCKGKTRTIFIVAALRKKLLRYAEQRGIREGQIFITRNGRPLNRSNIWRDMKALCEAAGVCAEKVFPHNLRHLFARMFYAIEKDIAKLADILGHSSINTTRIYIITTGVEHKRKMEQMRLIL